MKKKKDLSFTNGEASINQKYALGLIFQPQCKEFKEQLQYDMLVFGETMTKTTPSGTERIEIGSDEYYDVSRGNYIPVRPRYTPYKPISWYFII